jgi:ABC-type phosphate transport system substrate-binding protein
MKRILFNVLVLLILLAAPALSAEVAVIVNPSVPLKTITSTELLDVYSGDVKEWDDGSPIVVLDLKPKSSVKDAFYDYLGKSSSRMKSIWMKNMLSGEGRPPEPQTSGEELVQKVMNTPGAIGYVDRTLVRAGVNELVVITFEE